MTLFTDLQTAGLPVVSTNGEIQATFSRTLTDNENEIYWDLLFPSRKSQEARKADALNQAALAGQLKTVTPQQAVDYVVSQITSGTTEAQALTAFDNASTFAALKPILRNMLVSQYRMVDILKLMARLLIALRDAVMSELPER